MRIILLISSLLTMTLLDAMVWRSAVKGQSMGDAVAAVPARTTSSLATTLGMQHEDAQHLTRAMLITNHCTDSKVPQHQINSVLKREFPNEGPRFFSTVAEHFTAIRSLSTAPETIAQRFALAIQMMVEALKRGF